MKIKIQYYELWAMWLLLPNFFDLGGSYINEFVIGVALMNHPLYVTLFGAVVFTYMLSMEAFFQNVCPFRDVGADDVPQH